MGIEAFVTGDVECSWRVLRSWSTTSILDTLALFFGSDSPWNQSSRLI